MRIAYEELFQLLYRAVHRLGLEGGRAERCARLFAETSRDGVYSHGHLRFPRFAAMVRAGVVDPAAEAERVVGFGALERWDGRMGVGNLNAWRCMERAIELAGEQGIAAVALGNTNHWMRGGSYGWQAADAGMVGICWTNTMPNLPPWGASTSRVGNNPLVVAVPRPAGHLVLDMAMSQFSYGALESYRLRGERLPVDGGFDERGELTRDPAAIERSGRPLPIGFWKGSGLAVVLDLVAALLSGGRATHQLSTEPMQEAGVSQVFIAIDPARLDPPGQGAAVADAVVESLRGDGEEARFPGEGTLRTRARNLADGIPVDPAAWATLRDLAGEA